MKKASMRPDQLIVTTQGVKGGKTHTNKQGSVRITALKDYDSKQGTQRSENVIWVDVFTGTGLNYQPAENALINITFADGKQFNGTFDDLKGKLFANVEARNPQPIKQTNNKWLEGLTLPLKYDSGAIVDGFGKTVIKANRDSNTSPLSPAGRDAMLKLSVVLLNQAFEYDTAQRILEKLDYKG